MLCSVYWVLKVIRRGLKCTGSYTQVMFQDDTGLSMIPKHLWSLVSLVLLELILTDAEGWMYFDIQRNEMQVYT